MQNACLDMKIRNLILDEMKGKVKYEINLSNYQNISKISDGITLRLNKIDQFMYYVSFSMNLILLFLICLCWD